MARAKVNRSLSIVFIASLLITGISACSLSVPKPVSQDSSAIGISIRKCSFVGDSCEYLKVAYFARLNQEGAVTEPVGIYETNYNKDGQLYLLNMPPGNYTPVAGSTNQPEGPQEPRDITRKPRGAHTIYFPRGMVRNAIVEIAPGKIVYLGNHEINFEVAKAKEDLDDIQLRYMWLMQGRTKPPTNTQTLFRMMAIGMISNNQSTYAMSLRSELKDTKRDKESELEFLRKAKEHLKKSGWAGMVDRRLTQLASN